jgi:hypothetical protein
MKEKNLILIGKFRIRDKKESGSGIKKNPDPG